MRIWLDMDGTVANLYKGDWLTKLHNEDDEPYRIADRLVEEKTLLDLANNLNADLGIISWLAKNATAEYNKKVRATKKAWLKENYPNINFKIHIVKYGTPKQKFKNENDILIDDEEGNLIRWGMNALPAEILQRL